MEGVAGGLMGTPTRGIHPHLSLNPHSWRPFLSFVKVINDFCYLWNLYVFMIVDGEPLKEMKLYNFIIIECRKGAPAFIIY